VTFNHRNLLRPEPERSADLAGQPAGCVEADGGVAHQDVQVLFERLELVAADLLLPLAAEPVYAGP
jgi:hypothetical protein